MSQVEKQERYRARKREEAAPKRRETRLSKKIEEEEQKIQKQNDPMPPSLQMALQKLL